MHGGVSWQSFQLFAHIDQIMHLLVFLIELSELRIQFQRTTQGNVQLIWHHLGNTVSKIVGHIQYTRHIPDHTFGCQSTKSDDLYHLILTVFTFYILDNLLSPLITEVNINIGHGYTLRIQETLKQQIITDRVNVRNVQTVRYDTSRSTSSRSYRYVMTFRPVDKIPYDQEIINISHLLNNSQLIMQLICQCAVIIRIAFCQSVKTQLIQITPGVIPFRYIELRQLRHAKFDLHITAVSDPGCIIQCLLCIREELAHLQFTLYIVLTTLITHSVLIRYLLGSLDTQKNIMCLCILRIGIMDIVSRYQRDIQFLTHAHQCRIYCLLFRYSMILQFQEIIALSKACFIFECSLLCFLIESLGNISLHLSCQTR